jgi:hypothetical protein
MQSPADVTDRHKAALGIVAPLIFHHLGGREIKFVNDGERQPPFSSIALTLVRIRSSPHDLMCKH